MSRHTIEKKGPQQVLRLVIVLALASLAGFVHAEVNRVEPPNWWAGMESNRLQVMVYGDALGGLAPRIEYPGVAIDEVVRVENSRYLFLYLAIDDTARPGAFSIDLLRDGVLVERVPYRLDAREKDSRSRKGFDASDVIYLITPDRFANGNPSNDEVAGFSEGVDRTDKGGRHGGDLKGVIDHLDYIDEMGFTAIWLNPVLENNMERAYHGYATTDFYKVDPRFGSNEQYRELVRLAGERGIKVVMDGILNHSGLSHWFVTDPPTSDWVNFGGEFVQCNHRRQTNQDLYASEHDKRMFADGWFVEKMPDLNQRNPLMADYLIQNSIWWIEYAGLSGIRMDTHPYPDKEFMSRWSCELLQEYPRFTMVGEEWSEDVPIVAYWQRGKVNHDGYVSCMPSMMDFPLQAALMKALTEEPGEYHEPLLNLYEALALDFVYPDPFNLVIFPDNHDMARFFTQVGEDVDAFKMGMVHVLTMRGIPQIYYGTEILMDSSENPDDHGIIRTDFPGGWEGDKINAFTGDGLNHDQLETMEFMRNLLNWRKSKKVIHTGKLMHFAPEDGVYVYFRYNEEDSVMVVLNRNDKATDLETGKFSERTNGFDYGKDVVSGTIFPLDPGIRIPARSALVFELEARD